MTPTSPSTPRLQVADTRSGGAARLSGDIRHLIPKLGLRNYWYPAIEARTVGHRTPVKVSLLGEEICLFRGAAGDVAAIQDVCPHRGARLSEGDCHYRGTVACPYHGWVYDESGKNVMVLSEGPGSTVCGKAVETTGPGQRPVLEIEVDRSSAASQEGVVGDRGEAVGCVLERRRFVDVNRNEAQRGQRSGQAEQSPDHTGAQAQAPAGERTRHPAMVRPATRPARRRPAGRSGSRFPRRRSSSS